MHILIGVNKVDANSVQLRKISWGILDMSNIPYSDKSLTLKCTWNVPLCVVSQMLDATAQFVFKLLSLDICVKIKNKARDT